MESDLSSSDGALRMLFVEDVELLDKGILMSSGLSLWEESRRSALSDPCGGCAARIELFLHRFAHFMGSFVCGFWRHARESRSLQSILIRHILHWRRPPWKYTYICLCACASVRKNDLLRTQTLKRRSCAWHTCHIQGLIQGLTSGLTQRKSHLCKIESLYQFPQIPSSS